MGKAARGIDEARILGARRFELRDGREMVSRPIERADAPRLIASFERLAPRSRRLRFFSPIRVLTPEMARQFAEVDFERNGAFVATFAGEREVRAVGRYGTDASGTEVAFVVEDDLQGQGIATHLLERLVELARARGIVRFTAHVLAENDEMLEVFRNSGLRVRVVSLGDVDRVVIELQE